jgi:hypothetical protein
LAIDRAGRPAMEADVGDGFLAGGFIQMFSIFSIFLFGIPVIFRVVHLLRVQIQRLIMAVEGKPMGAK